ncbi:MAG: hypothetical protein HYT61_02905 [Candidatus Yanofskybacteria bacterium]|nr:hypothetical protein [Candidatus Yanofskybacteria bacterium]
MSKSAGQIVSAGDDVVLPVFVSKSIIFPSTLLKVTGFIKTFKLPEQLDEARFLVLKNETEGKLDSKLWFVGTVCSLEKKDNAYFLSGKSRAEAIKIWRDKGVLIASIKELEDISTIGELTGAQMPILWGCVESIRLFLKKWQEKIPKEEQELRKLIAGQLTGIDVQRREKEIIYSLPWHILVNFPTFFSLEFKEEMLKTDKVVDRLLSIVEKLQQEVVVSQYTDSFTDIDTASPINLEPEENGTISE